VGVLAGAHRDRFRLVLLVLSGGSGELVVAERAPPAWHALVVLLVALSRDLADVLQDVVACLCLEPFARPPLDPCLNPSELAAVRGSPVAVEPATRLALELPRRVDENGVIVECPALLEFGPPQVPKAW